MKLFQVNTAEPKFLYLFHVNQGCNGEDLESNLGSNGGAKAGKWQV